LGELQSDCSQCFALCCVGLAFSRSADFAVDKPAGQPCQHLDDGLRCGIHAVLRSEGYPGCTTYDCFGAGQRVSQVTFGGQDWRTHPASAPAMFAALPVMRQLHELLFYLADCVRAGGAAEEPALATARIEQLTTGSAQDLAALDLDALRASVNPLLLRVSAEVRGPQAPQRRGADLAGARLRGADLRGADLRGAYLISADLQGARLTRADLIGADLRNADLAGADLSDALFLTQGQVHSARGDARTVLSAHLARPPHWADS
jgi:hypothetical protein